jgi:hypothetical protein
MNRKLLVAWPVVFIAWMVGSFVVHGTLLHGDYAQLPDLFRTEADAQQRFPLMILAHVLMAFAFVWIYLRGIEIGPWVPQGIRFGLSVALLTVVPTYLIYYVVQPMPGTMAVKQIVLGSILIVLLGIVVAFMYRGSTSPRSPG